MLRSSFAPNSTSATAFPRMIRAEKRLADAYDPVRHRMCPVIVHVLLLFVDLLYDLYQSLLHNLNLKISSTGMPFSFYALHLRSSLPIPNGQRENEKEETAIKSSCPPFFCSKIEIGIENLFKCGCFWKIQLYQRLRDLGLLYCLQY